MRKHLPTLMLVFAALAGPVGALAGAAPNKPNDEKMVREILVPLQDLNVLLEGDPKRVLLSRAEYEALLAKAKKEAESRPPHGALVVSADYAATVGEERAEITGTLVVSVLEDGLHAVGLDVSGVGLRGAALDGKGAPVGLADDGRLTLFVEGKGRRTLVLDMVAPLQTTAARQLLNFRLPSPAASRFRLTVPGDVEVKSGAPVVSRVFDEPAAVTRIELLPQRGDTSLVMTLNSRLLRRDRIVVARSVLLDEMTVGYERLHATVSMAVLHRAVGGFRFAVPAGFEVTDVRSPNLARWAIETEGDRRILDVKLREETTDTVVLNISAVRTSPPLDPWALPRLEPLDVVGHVAVVGLAVEDRLKAESVEPEGLVPIDTAVLARALPATVLEAQPGAAQIRPVVAYYAPTGQFGLAARFVKPPAALNVTTNLLAQLEDGGLTVRGGFALQPEEEKLFAFDFSVPAGWDVTSVTGEDRKPIPFERYGETGQAARVHVRLPAGLPAGQTRQVYFTAVHVPATWFDPWSRTAVDFPVFAVAGAVRDVGALAVDARDDMTVRPEALEGLMPLDENEKTRYGLAGASANLAYRYDRRPYRARLTVERTVPRVTAQTFSFFRVERDALVAHYEIVYDVAQARTRRLALLLPADTPTALAIRGLDGVALKEYVSEPAGDDGKHRRWTALLAERRSGTVRLAIDFQKRLAETETGDLPLPIVVADAVAYQSGLVAVEGSPELDVRVAKYPRKVDIGELVDAEYQPGRRLLGAYGFVGDPPVVAVSVARHTTLPLPPAIIQRAELATVMSAEGVAQTAARFLLRTKALFLEVRLPEASALWSATLDGKPVKPQREGDRLLLSLPAAAAGAVRDLLVVYETPVDGMGFWRGVNVPSPRLLLHAGAERVEVPVADLQWHLYLPTGYKVVRSEGTVVTDQVAPPALALASMAGAMYYGSGGVDFNHGAIGLVFGLATLGGKMAPMAMRQSGREMAATGAVERNGYAYRRHGATNGPATGAEAFDEAESAPGDRPLGDLEPSRETLDGAKDEAAKPAEEPAPPPVTSPVEPPVPTTATPAGGPADKKPKAPAAKRVWALEGVSSLTIELQKTGGYITFRSLGSEPALALTVVDEDRIDSLAWALALAVIVVGLALTTRPAARKTAYIVGAGLVATLIPVITGRIELAMVANGAFYAACLLIPYYLVAHLVRWLVATVRGWFAPRATATAAALLLAVGAAVLVGAASAQAAETDRPYVVQIVPPPDPVKVPADAIILPYDAESKTGIRDADRLLVPYDRYVELWNQAYPDKPIGTRAPPAPYALAGATLRASLEGDEYLLVEGRIDLDVYTDEYAIVPLPLDGGVLARADLDGKPARLSVAEVSPPQAAGPKASSKTAPPKAFVVLYVSGKGRHQLDVAVRMRLEKRGGWRVAEGRLPAAPATAFALTVPQAATEVRLGGVSDRPVYETKAAGEVIRTALGASGAVSIQWRPKVGEGQVDRTLTADSSAVLDVQEDSLRLAWRLHLEFRHGERDFFTVGVPSGYTVEKVEGTNVRGWELKEAGAQQELTVTLLKRAKASEEFVVSLWRPTGQGESPFAGAEFDAPAVAVTGAIRHTGELVIRRSPLLDLRTVATSGVRRADLPAPAKNREGPGEVESPLGIRPYQAYRFVATPFSVRLTARPVPPKTTATVQTVLKIAERERSLEARIVLNVESRPLYRARFVVPDDLKLDRVLAPGTFEWALTEEAGRKILTVYLASGVQGACSIVVQGKLGEEGPGLQTALPRLEVLDVAPEGQKGDIAVQVDPAFVATTEGLKNIERVLLERVFEWLSGGQRAMTQIALHYARPDYEGRVVLSARKPDVSCFTVSNARVTDRAIEETILVNWTIRSAGIREVAFLLPARMKEARISAPLLRQKTVTPVADDAAHVRVRLELQDAVMDELRVLVEHDRLLTGLTQEAPIPVVETGRTDRRYVALESAGRDEVVVEKRDGLESLSRQQKEWAAVAGMLRGGMTQAFIVSPGAEAPRLAFRTKERAAVETAGARIGLAQALVILDSVGAYRGEQVYRLDNRTEQFLEVRLPEGASLWTAVVAGEPVKPTPVLDAARPRQVRIPIVKTAEGDLDYAVVLKYGGKVASLGALRWSLEFPLIRTAGWAEKAVELSQVRLYVPDTHVVGWFDTTMSPVTEEGTLEAEVLAYQNKLATRLIQTLDSSNPFAQTRARSNLVSVKQKIEAYTGSVGSYAGNAALQNELSNTSVIFKNAEKAMQQQEQVSREGVAYNNDFIRQTYEGQRNRRDRNLVQDLGPNWKLPAAQQPAQPDQTRFNEAWLEANRLENKSVQVKQRDVGGQQELYFEQAGRFRGGQRTAQPESGQGQAAGKMFQNFGALEDKEQLAKGSKVPAQRRGGVADVVERYQQKLEQQQAAQQTVEVPAVGLIAGRAVAGEKAGEKRGRWVDHRDTGLVVAPVTGMTSLDVELPRRGRLYQFTTPRGDVEITARAASVPLIQGLGRVGGVVLVVAIVLVLRRQLRGRTFDIHARSVFSTVLIVLGVVGIMAGIFPLAGLVAVAVGVAMKVRLFFARRQGVPTA